MMRYLALSVSILTFMAADPLSAAPPRGQSSDSQTPAARVRSANHAALREPSTAGYINAVQIYPYGEGVLYRLYAAPERVTDITPAWRNRHCGSRRRHRALDHRRHLEWQWRYPAHAHSRQAICGRPQHQYHHHHRSPCLSSATGEHARDSDDGHFLDLSGRRIAGASAFGDCHRGRSANRNRSHRRKAQLRLCHQR